ncbi:MAG: hypothetical protein V3U80_01925 [Flavobacteriaceae bacterium]
MSKIIIVPQLRNWIKKKAKKRLKYWRIIRQKKPHFLQSRKRKAPPPTAVKPVRRWRKKKPKIIRLWRDEVAKSDLEKEIYL